MSSQCEATVDSAGAFRRRNEREGKLPALPSRCRAAAAIVLMIVFAIAPCELRAQERVALTRMAHTTIVNVLLGKSQDVHTEQAIVDISVGDPGIADVNPLTDHALSILGKKIGTTRVTVYGEDKKLVGIFDIEVAYDISRASTEISALSGGTIRVSSVNGRILLTGTAADAVTVDKAVTIARQFVPDPINTVQVLRPQQIMLEVRFIEVSRSASRELGVQWNIFGAGALANIGNRVPAQQLPITAPGGAFQQPAAAGSGIGGMSVQPSNVTGIPLSPVTAAGVLSGAAPFGFLVSQLGGSVQMSLNALEQKGLARSLAEPNLVALSGDTASFLAGGQFPVPQANGLGTIAFAYQPYGVGLSFTPTVLRGGLINLVIKPEVSEIDTTHTVTVAGTSVPGLITRKASTTLELRDGQSFMLGGLLQNQTTSAQDQLPWVGDVPVLGALFRSAQYQKNETDLVIVVTPHIVNPMRPTNVAHSPLDSSLPANDVDLFLNGKAEISPAMARLAFGAPNRPYVGHILDLPKKGGAYVVAKD